MSKQSIQRPWSPRIWSCAKRRSSAQTLFVGSSLLSRCAMFRACSNAARASAGRPCRAYTSPNLRRLTSCKDTQIGLDDLTRFEHAVAMSLAEHGPVGGASLKYMRKSIPLSATALAELLHVAPETVSRWETGERKVDRAAWLVVRGLVLDPGARQDIAKLADKPSARPVAIAVEAFAPRFGSS
jgi:DNA-binding transcriptional regulator YiaG